MQKILGIVVGGGPAPGINGVISAATIEAINNGLKALGLLDGFKHIARNDTSHIVDLTIDNVSRIHFQGGSILRTSRENPTKSKEKMENVISSLSRLGISHLLTIGGDDTLFTSSTISAFSKEANIDIKFAHVPKTIDNDLPLPGDMPTFGFETARHVGTMIVQNLMEDSRTTGRWFIVVMMGRSTGHLALGVGKAAGATITLIPEEFPNNVEIDTVCTVLEGAIIKRLSMGRDHGVAIVAEGIAEKLSDKDLSILGEMKRDEHGHIKLAEIDFAEVLKRKVEASLNKKGINVKIMNKNIGYELRSANPIPFDAEYTRNLGFGAVDFLLKGGTDALVTIWGGSVKAIPFTEIIDPLTKKTKIRKVDINSQSYKVATKYMIRITKEDIKDKEKLKLLSHIYGTTEDEFINRFSKIV